MCLWAAAKLLTLRRLEADDQRGSSVARGSRNRTARQGRCGKATKIGAATWQVTGFASNHILFAPMRASACAALASLCLLPSAVGDGLRVALHAQSKYELHGWVAGSEITTAALARALRARARPLRAGDLSVSREQRERQALQHKQEPKPRQENQDRTSLAKPS